MKIGNDTHANATIETLFRRRSCRSFVPNQPVPQDDLKTIVQTATVAPSAMNAQAWHFTAIANPDALQRLNDAVFTALDESARTRITNRSADKKFNFFYRAPTLVLVSCDPAASVYAEADCACALENMFLAATALGLGSCWINQLTHNSFDAPIRALLTEFGIPAKNKIYGCAAIGYAQKSAPDKTLAANTVHFIL